MIVEIILLLSAVPMGLLLARLTREELKDGRKYFKVVFYVSFIIGMMLMFYNLKIESFSLIYLGIIAFISYINPEKLN